MAWAVVDAWVPGWCESNFGVGSKNFGVGQRNGVGGVDSVAGVGPNFGVDGVDLMCFVKDVLLNILQNLSEKHLHWGLLLNKVAG